MARDDGSATRSIFGKGAKTMAYDAVKRAAACAGLSRPGRCISLRHSQASDRNAPLHLVKQALGHTSLETTGRDLHGRPSDGSFRHFNV